MHWFCTRYKWESPGPPAGGLGALSGPPKAATVRIEGPEWQRTIQNGRDRSHKCPGMVGGCRKTRGWIRSSRMIRHSEVIERNGVQLAHVSTHQASRAWAREWAGASHSQFVTNQIRQPPSLALSKFAKSFRICSGFLSSPLSPVQHVPACPPSRPALAHPMCLHCHLSCSGPRCSTMCSCPSDKLYPKKKNTDSRDREPPPLVKYRM
jgi:hypothetical protein